MKGLLLFLGFVCLPALLFAQGHHYKRWSRSWRDPDVRVVVKRADAEPVVIIYNSDRYRAYRPVMPMRHEIRDQIRFQVRDQVRNTFRWKGWHSSHRIRRGVRNVGYPTRDEIRIRIE